MRAVKSRDTGPEMTVRRLTHATGYRYRLHRPDLPGTPDLVFPSRNAAIFVHGCFWHGHNCKRRAREANRDYWTAKVSHNIGRDAKQLERLTREGWRALVIWECELKDATGFAKLVQRFLGD